MMDFSIEVKDNNSNSNGDSNVLNVFHRMVEKKYAKKGSGNFSSCDDKGYDMLPKEFDHPKHNDLTHSTKNSEGE